MKSILSRRLGTFYLEKNYFHRDASTRRWIRLQPSIRSNVYSQFVPININSIFNIISANIMRFYLISYIGPILDDRLKEKLMKPWKGAHSSHFPVCLCVIGLQSTLFGLGTWVLGWMILGTWERNVFFFVFPNFHFYTFYGHFSIFSLYNTSKFLVSSYRS